MTSSEWIALISVLVAALGIASAVFTQIWQSRREAQRLKDARAERRRERLADEKLRLYSDFLTTTGGYEGFLWDQVLSQGDGLRTIPGGGDGDEESHHVDVRTDAYNSVPDLLSRISLVAPEEVRTAASDHDAALRWASHVMSLQVVDDDLYPDRVYETDPWEEVRKAVDEAGEPRERAVRAMRADLGSDTDTPEHAPRGGTSVACRK